MNNDNGNGNGNGNGSNCKTIKYMSITRRINAKIQEMQQGDTDNDLRQTHVTGHIQRMMYNTLKRLALYKQLSGKNCHGHR